jgi:acyl-CoA synthetase (AMP-forming)/AMP-acid ligase II
MGRTVTGPIRVGAADVHGYPEPSPDATFVACWDEVVRRHPDAPALGDRDRTVSYAEADRRARRVCAQVQDALPPGDAPVGVVSRLTVDGIVTLLGAVRTGRPAVLLDPHLPVERLRLFLEAAGVEYVVTDPLGAALAGRGAVVRDDTYLLVDNRLGGAPQNEIGH